MGADVHPQGEINVRFPDRAYAVGLQVPAADQAPSSRADDAVGRSGDRLPRSQPLHLSRSARTNRASVAAMSSAYWIGIATAIWNAILQSRCSAPRFKPSISG